MFNALKTPVVAAALSAAVSQIVTLAVAFGLINNAESGLIVAATMAVINVAIVVGVAIESNAKSSAKAKIRVAEIQAGIH